MTTDGTSAIKQETQTHELRVLESPRTTLYGKLAKVMAGVSRVPKNGWNAHFKYHFATESDIKDVIRPLLAEQNIAMIADMVSLNQDGKRTLVEMEFTFACGDTGATISKRFWGEALDNADKGINKAATFAEKYFLINFFMISTGEDPDGDETPGGTKNAQKNGTAPSTPDPLANTLETAQDAKSGQRKSAFSKAIDPETAVANALAAEAPGFVLDDEFLGKVAKVLPHMKREEIEAAVKAVGPDSPQMAMAAVLAKRYSGDKVGIDAFIGKQESNQDWWRVTGEKAIEVAPRVLNF